MLTDYIQTKGYAYEQYVYEKLKKKFDNIWFFKNVPEYVIKKTKLYNSYDIYTKYRNSDIGADLVAIKNDIVYFIQCKNYDTVISINDLSSFYFLLYEFNLNGLVYYNGKLSERIVDLSMGKVPFINLPFNNQLIDNRLLRISDNNIVNIRDYQLDAVKLLENENRSILSLPCGMGKTYTAYLLSRKYKNIIMIAPTRTLTEELLTNMDDYYKHQYNPILISMDGSRDINIIKSNLKELNIIASTYDSVDILKEILNGLEEVFIIIDEYHNLSENNLTDPTNNINQLLETNKKILFLSATPLKKNLKYFGEKIFKYRWRDAIENKYICDFKIVIPAKKNYIDNFMNMLNDLNYTESDIKLVNKAYFLLRSMLFEGSRKCITYLTCINNSELFKNILIWMQKLLNITLKIYQIDYSTTKIKRTEYIRDFKIDTEISIMLNVQILNEGINIVECDSVYITDPNNNIDNLIQRMSRSNRITKDKQECRIYLWCSEKKVNKIINYINENTNNELADKIFKLRFDNNKLIEEKYINTNINKKFKNITSIMYDNIINKVHNIYDNNNILWFNAKQICISLNYKQAKKKISKYVDQEDKIQLKNMDISFDISQQPDSIYINESGLYSLLITSRTNIKKKSIITE
jgi:superfamily II DNA or RNA helicase